MTFDLDPAADHRASPAARRGARRWPAPSPKSRTCCCSTSRPTISTSSPSRRWRRTARQPRRPADRQPRPRLPASAPPSAASGWRAAGSGGWTRASPPSTPGPRRSPPSRPRRLRRLDKAIERETYWFHRSITAQRTRNEGRARALAEMRQRKAAADGRRQPRPMAMTIEAGADLRPAGDRGAQA